MVLSTGDELSESAGLADPKFGLQLSEDRLAVISRNPSDKQLGTFAAQLMFGQFHRRQPRPKNSQPGIVVKAD